MRDPSRLHDTWKSQLQSEVPDLARLYASSQQVFPDRSQVFRALSATEFEQVRVVLLGQDPYDAAGLADGLAFSQPGAINKRSALHRIFLNLERDDRTPFTRPPIGDLSPWADRGVLLLNVALTVVENTPKSHLAIWKPFTEAILRSLDDPDRGIAFILLGADAVDLATSVLQNVSADSFIRAAHPMAGYPGDERPFHVSRVFSEANDFLGSGDPIDWNLS